MRALRLRFPLSPECVCGTIVTSNTDRLFWTLCLQARNLVNAALYVLDREQVRDALPASGKADLARDTFPALLEAGRVLQGYVSPEYIKDMGTPQRLAKVEADARAGLPERLSDRHPRRAVFL